jgi:(1->4)-alpha-D-glucan 1-alpha-D-glucosylmutase
LRATLSDVTRPTATSRLQLTPDFGFADVVEQLDTIGMLGVSHLYLSPIAQAVPTSSHGYDVTDHTTVRREFGGEAGLERLLDAAAERDMGVIIDHVPNHTSVEYAHLNDRWWSMLRDGPESESARWFDVDWAYGDGAAIIPRLGEPLDVVLDSGGIETGVGDLGPELRYGPLRFPLAAGTEDLDVRDAVRRQHYRLAWWRDPERNVRRFFTIDDLVGVRVEHADVARAVDSIPRRLCAHPAFDGVRIDHIDGLADPTGYLVDLREVLGDDRLLFVEKILGPGERLPPSWPVDGTTGYEHITAIEHAVLDPASEAPLMELWSPHVRSTDFHELESAARREVIDDGLAPDVDRVVRDVLATDADLDVAAVRSAIVDITMQLDRYRTYLPEDSMSVAVLSDALDGVSATAADRVGMRLSTPGAVQTRWQQLTGPVMAKGAEDRAFYRWFPLASLSEVGGQPGHFSAPIASFHAAQRERQRTMPSGMLASTTHDTKRSSGVRARSLALASVAEIWSELVDEWSAAHEDLMSRSDPRLVLLALQTAVTARPLTAERLADYLVKAAREADLITSWTEPDAAAESALRLIAQVLVDEVADAVTPLALMADRVEETGHVVDLALLAVQLTCPGFPDLYQGAPMGLFSLVDPDNRRPPQWLRLAELVEAASSQSPAVAWSSGEVDLTRVSMTRRILSARAALPDAFGSHATYVELEVTGAGAEHVLAFGRGNADGIALIVVTRRSLSVELDDDSIHLNLPQGSWTSVLHDDLHLSGGRMTLTELFGAMPLAVLRRI